MPDASLVGHRVNKHKEHSQREGCLVRSVGPQSVCTTGNSEAGDRPEDKGPQQCIPVAILEREQTNDTGHVGKGKVDHHRPIQVIRLIMVHRTLDTILNNRAHRQ